MGRIVPGGWVKSHRKMKYSEVWSHHNASRAFQALLWDAESTPTPVVIGGKRVVLQRGQAFTMYQTFAAENYFSVDQVRRAFGVLKDLGMITCEGGRHGVVVTILNYERYQAVPVVSTEGEGQQNSEDDRREVRREAGEETAANTAANTTSATGDEKTDSGDSEGDDRREARHETAAKPASKPAAPYRGSKNIRINNNPPTPFFKGGVENSFSSSLLGTDGERVEAVLAMWREELTRAGLSALPGRRDREGAEILARDYLASAGMSMKAMRSGMRKIIGDIASDPKCKLFNLKTLAKEPRRYCPAEEVVVERKQKAFILWDVKCDVCGAGFQTELPASEPPPQPEACPFVGGSVIPVSLRDGPVADGDFCQGTMRAVKIKEYEK